MLVQKTEAPRRKLELARSALAQDEADLQQRDTAFQQARVSLDEALASSRQTVTANGNPDVFAAARIRPPARRSEAKVWRLRKALDEAVARKEAPREVGNEIAARST